MSCEMEDCTAEAVCAVHAQWTLVDFVEYAMCEEHQWDAVQGLRVRQVDGVPPFDVWTTWWDLDAVV